MASLSSALRWLRINPGGLVALLLMVEGLLWLSNRLDWPHWHKGYAVLVAVAMVGVVLLAMLVWFAIALVFRLRFQFTIRTLLVLTVAVALPFSWFGVEMKKAWEQAAVTAAIERGGGAWVYDWGVAIQGRLACHGKRQNCCGFCWEKNSSQRLSVCICSTCPKSRMSICLDSEC